MVLCDSGILLFGGSFLCISWVSLVCVMLWLMSWVIIDRLRLCFSRVWISCSCVRCFCE